MKIRLKKFIYKDEELAEVQIALILTFSIGIIISLLSIFIGKIALMTGMFLSGISGIYLIIMGLFSLSTFILSKLK
ncbi:MAG: hypothetical protein COA63_014310 [Methylophaga sp.]|nr:hypothetical protein [Methylophaga sp.]